MANELRVRQNFMGGKVEDNPLSNSATTLNSAALAAAVAIGSTQHLPITLDPDGLGGEPEVIWVTSHTAAATSATILRGQEGTTARAHNRDTDWSHGPTTLDVPEYPTRAARGYKNAAQSIPNATWTTLTWNVESYDQYGILNAATGVFTPGKTGLYLCSAICVFAADTTGRRGIAITKNGSQVAFWLDTPTGGGFDTYRHIAQVISIGSITDTIEIQGYQDRGSSLNTGSSEPAVNGSVVRIGDV